MSKQPRVIFDTDMCTDCDDVGAHGILHALADNGEVEILCCASSYPDYYVPGVIDVINTYYARPDLRVGTWKAPEYRRSERYPKHMSENFPCRIKNADDAEDAVALYREILSGQDDGSVTLVTIGGWQNVHDLLRSPSDSHSALNGIELVAAKLKEWSCMGGFFPDSGENSETNLKLSGKDKTVWVLENWPEHVKIVFAGGEIAGAKVGSVLASQTPEDNPVREAYRHFYCVGNQCPWCKGTWPCDHHCADLNAVLYAVRGKSPYYGSVDVGHLHYDPETGHNEWRAEPAGNQAYLTHAMPRAALKRVFEELLVQPPRGRPA